MSLAELKAKFEEYKGMNLNLNMQRGQPSDDNFNLSNTLLEALAPSDTITESGIEIRNYPGGVQGLKEARTILSKVIGVNPDDVILGNNSSLRMLANTLMWSLIKGVKDSDKPWGQIKPKMIVTVPGYDRHFRLLNTLGFEMLPVQMTPNGPDINEIEKLAKSDDSIKGLVFVPTYSNPTGDTVSDEVVERLAKMETKAKDFTIFADDAYVVHHLTNDPVKPKNLLQACKDAGNPDRVYIFGSTSKITFSGAGIGIMGSSSENIKYIVSLIGCEFIGPNKIEQLRHYNFIKSIPGEIEGLMKQHAEILKPKFDAVEEILSRELKDTDLAEWTKPKGGYFVSLTTKKPVASKVVDLAKELGLALTPAGATFPFGKDPNNSNIRISPTRPPVKEVSLAMEIVALCIKIASAE